MDGVQLCARFSFATSRLQYCGPDGADSLLYRTIVGPGGTAEARRALSQFEALMPYLEAIGRKHGLDPFDPKVVEAYWIGNELLDAFGREDFLDLLDRLRARGLPRSLAQRLKERLPAGAIPHHVFHVCYVGVGNVTGHVETNLANMESCRPSWGELVSQAPGSMTVRAARLEVLDGKLALGAARDDEVPYDPRVIPELGPGDKIAVHWRTPALRLSEDQSKALRQYSLASLAAVNDAPEARTGG